MGVLTSSGGMSMAEWMRREGLPEDFSGTVDGIYRPLARQVAAWHGGRGPMLLGINGGQGTGKSTMAMFLRHLLEQEQGLATALLSIDDLYLTRAARIELGERVHPLLRTRGVPGTHDPHLGMELIDRLMSAGPGDATALPRFSKAIDDRLPFAEWPVFRGRADLVIFEGWCVGARPQPEEDLQEPLNALERDEDRDGRWRRWVNAQLAGSYRACFDRIDRLVFLRAPDMACIRAWRAEQEDKLRRRLHERGEDASGLMDGAALDRFIDHYQRLTEHQWRELPSRADAVLQLAPDHRILGIGWRCE